MTRDLLEKQGTLTLLFFSSDGWSFHANGADEWKMCLPKCTVYDRGTIMLS